jgi:hypothetical protein
MPVCYHLNLAQDHSFEPRGVTRLWHPNCARRSVSVWRWPPQCFHSAAELHRCVAQAVCYLRPTRENIARLRRELRDPRYGEYHLCARPV